jgi:hypothetical protein
MSAINLRHSILESFDSKNLARLMNERLIHLRAVCPADGFALSELYTYKCCAPREQ